MGNKWATKERAKARTLIGKTIVMVALRPYDDGRGGIAFNPLISFTDGTALTFQAQETETDSGVILCVLKPKATQ